MKHRTHARIPRSALLLSGFLLLASCGAPRGTSTTTLRGGEGSPDLEEEDTGAISSQLEYLHYRSERRDGRLHAQFDLHNKRSSDLSVEWSIEWQDSSGFHVDAPERWTPVVIAGKSFQTITVTAPTPEASQFRLHFRAPNPVR